VLAQPSADMVAQRCMRVNLLPAYDSKVDIWACGVLVHEALTGLTPFHDADPQTAALKAQFRPPRQLGGATPACADFVAQALTKQAAKRPTALQLLAHPWVLTHAGVQHVLAASPLCMPTAPIRITKAACTPQMELISCSAPLAASSYMPAAAPSKQPQPAAQPEPKQLPQQTRPQQLPPHPFAASQGMLLECRALSGPVQLEAVDIAAADDATGFAAVAAQGPLELLTSPLPACKQRGGAARPGFVRQLSSPVLVKSSRQPQVRDCCQWPAGTAVRVSTMPPGCAGWHSTDRFHCARGSPCLLQEPVLLPAPSDPPSSPPPSRVSMLAASPVRALLLGAGRHLMRQRSGGNAPSDGVPGTRTTSVRRSSFSLMRSPLPRAAAGSPIRGLSLLQGRRRVPPPAPASASLFAAAQWKPAAGQGSLASAASVCSSSGGPPAALSKASSSDCSPSIMSAFGGHSSCGSISSSIAADRTGSQPLTVTASRSSSGAVADAAAVEAPHGHQQCAGAASPHSASGGSQHLGSGRSRALFLSRTPSAPDPGPLLVAGSPPVRHGSGAARAAPSGGGDAVADQRPPSGLQSMRCVWLKVCVGLALLTSRGVGCAPAEGCRGDVRPTSPSPSRVCSMVPLAAGARHLPLSFAAARGWRRRLGRAPGPCGSPRPLKAGLHRRIGRVEAGGMCCPGVGLARLDDWAAVPCGADTAPGACGGCVRGHHWSLHCSHSWLVIIPD
jgi:hypothetical protein